MKTTVQMTDFRNLSPEERAQKCHELTKELAQLRLRATAVGVERPSEFQRLRRDIARLNTVAHEQQARQHGN